MENMSLRIPEVVYKRLKKLQTEKPHLSLNALIVEAILYSLDKDQQNQSA